MLGLLEALEQLHHECNKDDDLCPNVELEKAVYHWGAVLYTFTLFPEGKVALGQCHLEVVCNGLYIFQGQNMSYHIFVQSITKAMNQK